MLKQRDNAFYFKCNALLRQFIIRGGWRPFTRHYTVNEYPKSGGTWLGQMLAEMLDLPFPRNQLPLFTRSIMHGHYLHPWNMKDVVVVWRDGRDVLISQYFHSLFVNEKGNRRLVNLTRARFKREDYEDLSANLCAFIEYTYRNNRWPAFSWADFTHQWADRRNVTHVKYEDLRMATASELRRIHRELLGRDFPEQAAAEIADKYSFEKQSGRAPGVENRGSFMRKGVVGDWKNHFTPEARELFDAYAGEALIKLGYEPDHSWARQC